MAKRRRKITDSTRGRAIAPPYKKQIFRGHKL
nr:MAG TPA_asm: hypothetical protein [Caudoviricetes sp.]